MLNIKQQVATINESIEDNLSNIENVRQQQDQNQTKMKEIRDDIETIEDAIRTLEKKLKSANLRQRKAEQKGAEIEDELQSLIDDGDSLSVDKSDAIARFHEFKEQLDSKRKNVVDAGLKLRANRFDGPERKQSIVKSLKIMNKSRKLFVWETFMVGHQIYPPPQCKQNCECQYCRFRRCWR